MGSKVVGACHRCGVLGRDAGGGAPLTRIEIGHGCTWVPGRKGPAGWRRVGDGRWVNSPRTERVCDRCLGRPRPELPQPGPAAMAMAAGFTRHQPSVRA